MPRAAKIGDFNLSMDPSSLDPEAAARREALKTALAALDGEPT